MPTPRGWIVGAGGAALLAAGTLLGYAELAVLGALAVLAVAAAAAFVLLAPPARATVTRTVAASRLRPGTATRVRLSVDTQGRRRPGRLAERVADADGARTAVFRVTGQTREVGYDLTAERRGVVELGPVRVGGADPLGLARWRRRRGGTDRVWVHPDWRVLRALPVGAVSDPDGALEGARGGGLTFHALRDYAPGDEARHVHWLSTARRGRLTVREYADTSHPRLTVLVDDRVAPGGRTALDEVADAAGSVLATAVRAGLDCEVHLLSGRGADGSAGLPPLLDLLAEAHPARGADLAAACARVRDRAAGDAVVLVSPELSATDLRAFGELRHRFPALVAAVVGPAAPPPAPGVTAVHAESTGEFVDRWNEAPWTR
ncbi:DUF58 domain-containing protein [Marinitenerispora sediminis]|uniref:DUF58 domain-containing protein n=1 Tax=Marinitenerispora sediminis TaxID=1931232 RepID=A0A368T6E6_9ACTN|nr:DUF58 domain-containing protein [Marinitenerispora sediminis]RCV53246.1 DUF58 domain-containing protein [Marinitenerispora sediminis]RCV54945.1 DUF58 domain-containing protein [Marinitenerispora sediminis]RCV59068.1 DUF58 domain-containing protein [Marinitenerispora sediminis]